MNARAPHSMKAFLFSCALRLALLVGLALALPLVRS